MTEGSDGTAIQKPRRIVIVGGSPRRPSRALLQKLLQEEEKTLVIACDSGVEACLAAGVRVDLLVGDDDSASASSVQQALGQGARHRLFPAEKDETDLLLGLMAAREICDRLACPPGQVQLMFTGVTGGRMDHALAAYGTVARVEGFQVSIAEDGCICHVLNTAHPRWCASAQDVGKTVSVIALPDSACVSESGMQWSAARLDLGAASDRGVSNKVLDAQAQICVHSGTALVFVFDR